MSAFLVSPHAIAALVVTSTHGPRDASGRWWKPTDDERAVFEMLATENARSVGYRYNEPTKPVDYVAWPFGSPAPSIVEALKLLDCYEYQACECQDWEDSEAFRWCYRLRKALGRALPGYDSAAWEA